MNDVNDRLDQLLNKERHKKIRLYSILFALFILICVGVVAYSTGDSFEVEANVISLHSEASEQFGEHFYIFVDMDGNTMKLKIPRETKIRKGNKVLLLETYTNLFGLKNYSFIKVKE